MTEELLVNSKTTERKRDFSKCYLCLALVLFLALLALGGFTYYYIFHRKAETACVSQDCLRASLEVVTSVDSSVDPCENFYQFTCGKYSNNKLYLVSRDSIREERMNGLITEDITEEEWPPLLLQKKFYRKCLEQPEDENDDFSNNTLGILEQLGGWPILEHQWDNSHFNLTVFLIKCLELSLPFEWLFRISYGIFSINEDVSLVQIAKPVGIEEFVDPLRTAAYLELIVEIVEGFNGSRTIATHEAKKIIDFESELHKIWKHYDSTENTPKPANYLREIFKRVNLPYLIENVTSEYLESGNSTLIAVNESIMKNLNLLLAGTSSWFPMVANFAYDDKYLDGTKMALINEMVSVIKGSFISHLENVQWISNQTKSAVTYKIENMKVTVKIDENGQDIYKNILNEITEENYNTTSIFGLLNLQTLYDFQIRLTFMNATSLDPTQFDEDPVYDFTYDDEANEIVLPATVLEDYFYIDGRPQYINYGLLGSLISREIARSLEMDASSGSPDPDKPYLWKNDGEESYTQLFIRSRCIVDQYIDAGNKIHNDKIFSENYVNLISLDFAYESYLNWVEKNKPEISISFMDYSPDKLFWIYSELQFCAQGDDDIPLEYRATNPIKNSRYFENVFECPDQSNNEIKEKKCIIF